MDYGEILKKAWKTIWKHKILWLFGVLAGCGAVHGGAAQGGGGSGSGAFNQSNPFNGQHDPFFFNNSIQRALEDFLQTLAEIPVGVWVLIAVVLMVFGVILSILFLMVGTLGTAGVIKGTSLAEESDADAKPISLGAVIEGVKPTYWKVFLLNLGLRVAGTLIGLLLAIPIVFLMMCTCCLGLFLLIPVTWLINLMVDFTTIAIIEEDLSVFEGIERAWTMITRHLGTVFVMFLILGIGQLLVGLIIGLPLVTIPIPLLVQLAVSGAQSIGVGLILSGLLSLVFIPLVIFLSGVVRAYVLTSWTLTFRQLSAEDRFEPTVLFAEDDES